MALASPPIEPERVASTRRWIAHLDMDAFYASVELLRYPQLQGEAVVIGGRRRRVGEHDEAQAFERLHQYAGRGVITTATYPARALGLHSGMGLMKAAALAPMAYLLPADFDEYRRLSAAFKAAVAARAPVIEDRGIDEIYIDLSALPGVEDATPEDPCAGVRAIGQELRERVRAATGLSCSIGITPNKLLSKLCSDLEKPGGLTLITSDDLPTRIWPLPASRINGIGPKAYARLQALGVHTIGDLAQAERAFLTQHFGPNYGAWLHEAAWGRDERPVVTERELKSLSRETTFERDLHARHDRAELGAILTRLCEQVAADLKRKGLRGRTMGVKLRFDDFRIVTRDQRLEVPTDDPAAIRRAVGQCLKRVPLEQRLRLLGVRASALCGAETAGPMPAHEPTQAARRANRSRSGPVGSSGHEPGWGQSLPLFTA
jgi:DNA polymerase IV